MPQVVLSRIKRILLVFTDLKWLQISHFILIGVCTLLVLLFLRFSEENVDAARDLVEVLCYVITGMWAVTIFILSLLEGGEENALKKLRAAYIRFLTSIKLLLLLNVILMGLLSYLAYQTLWFRQVSVTTEVHKEFVVKLNNEDEIIGRVSPEQEIKIRLPLGEGLLFYYSEAEPDFYGRQKVQVEPLWKKMPLIILPDT